MKAKPLVRDGCVEDGLEEKDGHAPAKDTVLLAPVGSDGVSVRGWGWSTLLGGGQGGDVPLSMRVNDEGEEGGEDERRRGTS